LCEQRKKGISFRYFLWAIKENDKYVLLTLLQSVECTKQESLEKEGNFKETCFFGQSKKMTNMFYLRFYKAVFFKNKLNHSLYI
jgi:hypothetical protein